MKAPELMRVLQTAADVLHHAAVDAAHRGCSLQRHSTAHQNEQQYYRPAGDPSINIITHYTSITQQFAPKNTENEDNKRETGGSVSSEGRRLLGSSSLKQQTSEWRPQAAAASEREANVGFVATKQMASSTARTKRKKRRSLSSKAEKPPAGQKCKAKTRAKKSSHSWFG